MCTAVSGKGHPWKVLPRRETDRTVCKMVAFHDLKAFSGDFSDELSLLLDTKTAFMDPETIWVLRTNQHSEVEWGNFLKHFSYSPEYEFVLIFTLDKAYRLVYSAVAWSLDC